MDSPHGLEAGVVRVVPYDPRWPALFTAEAGRLQRALAPLPAVIEHTGSTSVPGLAAKPVLDILIGIPDGREVQPYIESLVAAGYVHRGEQGIPGREFFRMGSPRSYHIHLARFGNAFWRDHLAFRDYLRLNAEAREEYRRVKLSLAAEFPRDRERYIEGKADFVRRALTAAAAGKVRREEDATASVSRREKSA